VPAALLSLVALGALTSVAFNTTLGRSEFASETLWDRTYWGLKLAVPPVFVLLIGWLAQSVLLAFWRVAAGLSARARRLDERMRTRIAHATRDPAMLFSGVLILAAIALVASWIHFRPLLVAMTSFVRFAPADSIAILGPDYDGHHDLYTFVFSVLIAGTTAAWLIVSRIAARQRIAISRNLLAGGIVVLCLQVASLAISYRLLVHNTAPAVRWSGETCYVTGERDDRWLLFCPARDTDRNQVVRRGDPLVVDLGRQESLFTGIGGSRAASGS
jgi:hypothetical protein